MDALITIAIVTTGSAREVSAADGSCQSSRGNPPDGNHPRVMANTSTSRIPTQNTGTAMPSCENADSATPYQRSAFHAATKPIGSASTSARPNERSVSGTVTDSRAAISGPTGRELMNDSPRFSVRRLPNHEKNCCSSG